MKERSSYLSHLPAQNLKMLPIGFQHARLPLLRPRLKRGERASKRVRDKAFFKVRRRDGLAQLTTAQVEALADFR